VLGPDKEQPLNLPAWGFGDKLISHPHKKELISATQLAKRNIPHTLMSKSAEHNFPEREDSGGA